MKSDDSYQDGGFEASKTTTVTRMATPRGSIPVTVGTFEAWRVRAGIPLGRTSNREHIYFFLLCVYRSVYVNLYMYTCICVYRNVHMYTCVYVSICMCVYIYMYMRVQGLESSVTGRSLAR